MVTHEHILYWPWKFLAYRWVWRSLIEARVEKKYCPVRSKDVNNLISPIMLSVTLYWFIQMIIYQPEQCQISQSSNKENLQDLLVKQTFLLEYCLKLSLLKNSTRLKVKNNLSKALRSFKTFPNLTKNLKLLSLVIYQSQRDNRLSLLIKRLRRATQLNFQRSQNSKWKIKNITNVQIKNYYSLWL